MMFLFFPVIDSMQLDEGMISVVVTPEDGDFKYEWKFNGETMAGENDATIPLPHSVSGGDQVEVLVSSDCAATTRASILMLMDFPSTSPNLIAGESWKCMSNYSISCCSTLYFFFP